MSKSDNIKRAKLLHKRKKEKEQLLQPKDNLELDLQKLQQLGTKEGFIIVDRSVFGKKEKISTLVLEMVYPLFKDAKDEEDVRNIVTLGVLAWNCGIIKAVSGETELQKAVKNLRGKDNFENKQLVDDYILIKCNKYGQFKDFITKFELSFDNDGKLNLSVLTGIS